MIKSWAQCGITIPNQLLLGICYVSIIEIHHQNYYHIQVLSLERDASIHLNAFDQATIIYPPLDASITQPAHGTNESTHVYMFRT